MNKDKYFNIPEEDKNEAIEYFKNKYNCIWKEDKNQITINEEAKLIVLKPSYTLEIWGTQWLGVEMIEDLLSILHMYYIGK